MSLIPCKKCGLAHEDSALKSNFYCCPDCAYHYRIGPVERLHMLADSGSFKETEKDMASRNPLEMEGYEEKLQAAYSKCDMNDAVTTGTCSINSRSVVIAIMNFAFMGGSMGSVVGEKIMRSILYGARKKLPVLIYATSGGARMQEGIFSLMQMAKTSSAALELERQGMPLFIVLCDPTTGGVTASFAMLGDVTIAEPEALIGFAGARVIEGTIKQTLPEGFQRAEFQLKKGFVDMIVPRNKQKEVLSFLLDSHCANTNGSKEKK